MEASRKGLIKNELESFVSCETTLYLLTAETYIVLAALNEFSLDIEQLTIEFAEPQAISDAWDAGIIDGAGCWGNTLHHLTTKPHGGDNETEPGHILVARSTTDAGAVPAFLSADTQWYKLDEGQELQATLAHAFRCSVPRIVSRVDRVSRGSEEPAPRGILPGLGREPGCVSACIYMCN